MINNKAQALSRDFLVFGKYLFFKINLSILSRLFTIHDFV